MTPSVTLTKGVVMLDDEGDVLGSDAGAVAHGLPMPKKPTFST